MISFLYFCSVKDCVCFYISTRARENQTEQSREVDGADEVADGLM